MANIIDIEDGKNIGLGSARSMLDRYLSDRGIDPPTFYARMDGWYELLSYEDCMRRMQYEKIYDYNGLQRYGLLLKYPGDLDYSVMRVLNPGWNKKTDESNPKMVTPQGVTPPIYIPPDVGPQQDIYVCESVLKSIVVSGAGFCAMGGNGVFGSFPKGKLAQGWPHIWMKDCKRVLILFDSDVSINENVKLAADRLAYILGTQYPHIQVVNKLLPAPPDELEEKYGGKWGVDDFAAHYGRERLKAWLEGGEDEVNFTLEDRGRHRLELGAQYAVCMSPAGVVKLDTGEVYPENVFCNVLEAPRQYEIGDKVRRMVSSAKDYMKWERRTEVDLMRYVPGAGEGLCTWNDKRMYNLWRDDGPVAVEGDVSIWLEFWNNAIPVRRDAKLMEQMIAWGLQNRGQRWEKCLMLISHLQSTGKSTIATTIGALYGSSNFASVPHPVFEGSFSGTWATKEVVLVDDIGKLGDKGYTKMQTIVTDKTVHVNPKGKGDYINDNYINLIMTSNRLDAVTMVTGERRLFIVEVTPTVRHLQGDPYWVALNDWLRNGGLGALRWYYEHLDLTGYNPMFDPPNEGIKAKMETLGAGREKAWVDSFGEDMFDTWNTPRKYFTAEELLPLFLRDEGCEDLSNTQATKKRIGDALAACGYQLTTKIKIAGKLRAYWNIRDGNGVPSNQQVHDDHKMDPTFGTKSFARYDP